MKKLALLSLVAVLSLGLMGCVSPPPPKPTSDWWTEANKDKMAMISSKEMVPIKDHPEMSVSEYRVELVWLDVRRKTLPSSVIIVDVETYQSVKVHDYVNLEPWYADKEGNHVRVYYFWRDASSGRQYRVDYEYEDVTTPDSDRQ